MNVNRNQNNRTRRQRNKLTMQSTNSLSKTPTSEEKSKNLKEELPLLNQMGLMDVPTNENQEKETGTYDPLDDAPKRPTGKYRKLETELSQTFGAIGLVIYAVNEYDGQVILQRGKALSERLVDVSVQNENFYVFLKSLVDGGVYAGLIMEMGLIASLLLKNHGIDLMSMALSLLKREKKDAETSNTPIAA